MESLLPEKGATKLGGARFLARSGWKQSLRTLLKALLSFEGRQSLG